MIDYALPPELLLDYLSTYFLKIFIYLLIYLIYFLSRLFGKLAEEKRLGFCISLTDSTILFMKDQMGKSVHFFEIPYF